MDSSQRCREVIQTCGVELVDGSIPVLHTPSTLFRYQLNEAIRSDADLVAYMGDYLDELLSDHDAISLYLDPMTLGTVTDDSTATMHVVSGGLPQTESLVRLMLGVDALQSRLVATLVDKFPEYIGDEGTDGDASATKVSVKILRQLRWLDYVLDSGALTEKLLETLGFVPPDMQREIVVALPDIISDSDNTQVTKVLASMLKETPELMLPVLDTLGSLDCAPALLQGARNSVISHLASAEPIELPVLLRFLLQSVSADAAAPVIMRIRKRLDVDSIVLASRQRSASAADQSPDVLIFDAIATSLRSHKHLRDAWLKIIASDADNVGSQTTLDLVVLLILHQITTHTKRVESALKAKIDIVSSQPIAYTPALFESNIARFPAVFSVHFPALVSVSGWLIQTSALGSQGSRVATSILVSAFAAMGMFQRQEISGELAVHIGSGNVNEIDTAAHIYLELATKHPYELRPFAVFIKGLLDYVDNLDIAHVRTIFDTLGILSTLAGGADDSMFSDLYIFVRKQLSSVFPKYNRIGVVGTVSLLRQLGGEHTLEATRADDECAGSSMSQAPRVNIQALRRAVQLLEMLMDSGRHQSWTFISMTYDELAHIVETHGLHQQLLMWLHENVSSKFAAQFLGDVEDLSRRYLLSGHASVALSLDDDETAVLDVFNHNDDAETSGLHAATKRADADDGDVPRLRGCVLSCLPSLLRLIQVCEKALGDGSLGEIDALLVCGIYLLPPIDVASPHPSLASPSASQYNTALSDDSSGNASLLLAGNALVGIDEDSRLDLIKSICRWPIDLRRALCTSLYVAVNWFREVINAFADQDADEVRAKVIMRVNQLEQIERGLEALAESLSGTNGEFHPQRAGLIPEMSDTAARTATNGLSLRISGPGTLNPTESVAENMDVGLGLKEGSFMVDVGGLLLSQEDTHKLVHGTNDEHLGDASAKKRGRKRKSTGAAPVVNDFAKELHPFLRELSFSAFDILKLDEADRQSEHRPLLSARGLSVILRELQAAVASKLVRRAEKRVPWGKPSPPVFGALATFSSNIAGSSARDVFSRVRVLFPSLLQYLDACLHVRARFRNDVDEPEQLSHAPRIVAVDSLSDVSVVELCIDRLLHIVSAVLSWDGLQTDSAHTHESSLTLVLGALARQGQRTHADEISNIVPNVLVRRAFDYLHDVAQMVATSMRAIDVLRMLVAVRSFAPSCESFDEISGMTAEQRIATMDGRISGMARRVLDAKWDAIQELRPADLELLVGLHIIRCPHNRLDLAYTYAAHILPQSIQGSISEDVDDSEALATLKPATFAPAYKAVSQALATIVQDSRLTNMGSSDMVQFSGRIVDTWVELTRITQTLDASLQRTVLIVALRSGLTMTDLFAKTILPLLDACFFTHRDEIVAVLERMRKATRILQSICNHSKASQDTKLQSAVPQTKRKLEQLIFQVYVLMGNNDSMSALTLGRLKHRGVRGEVVSSQIPRDYESEGNESEAEEEGEEEEESDRAEDVQMESASDDNVPDPALPPTKRNRGHNVTVRSKVGKRMEVLQRKEILAKRRKSADNSAALDTLNPTTFASAYKAVNQVLVTVVQDSRLRNLSSSDMVQFSGRIVDTWVKLTRITQTLDASLSRSMLIVALRSGLTMTDLFAKTILPLLAACFFTHRDEIVAVLERMRKATRILQSVCNYPKTSQDTKLQSAVPQTKRKLEQLIFQVYVLMGNNDSMSALTLGRLKHLIVRSEDVSLQILRDYESEDNESETESDQAENDQLESESNDNVPDPAPVQAKGGRSVIVRSKVDK
ncbi:Fanconi anemia group D2 protein [Coemansia sp. RSA 1822]|nr:Fanconi anemia group D2 protein [Coemansia sp. RSA 638]KAJ2563256.1 Fanconi anemia group D2 protein [Coemansia sp. RSA 1822]